MTEWYFASYDYSDYEPKSLENGKCADYECEYQSCSTCWMASCIFYEGYEGKTRRML